MNVKNSLDVINLFLEMVNTEKPPENLDAALKELDEMGVPLTLSQYIDTSFHLAPMPLRVPFTGEMLYCALLQWYLKKIPNLEVPYDARFGDWMAATINAIPAPQRRNAELLVRLEKIYGPMVRQAMIAGEWLSIIKEDPQVEERGDKRIWNEPWHLNKKGWWGQSWLVWFVGLPGSGKSTLAAGLYLFLLNHEKYLPLVMIDGDMTRRQDIVWAPGKRMVVPLGGMKGGADFTKKTRLAHAEKFSSFIASLMPGGGKIIGSSVFPYAAQRKALREVCGEQILLVHVRTPSSVCSQRKPHLYKRREHAPTIHEFEPLTEEERRGGKFLSLDTSIAPLFHLIETIITSMESLGWIERGLAPIKCSTLGI